jgi:hypothetical protein
VHRNDQRGRQGGKEEIAAGVMTPLLEAAGPAHGEHREYFFAKAAGIVAHDGQIGQHAGVPEQGADRQIGTDGDHVEHERRLEIGPEVALIGKGSM